MATTQSRRVGRGVVGGAVGVAGLLELAGCGGTELFGPGPTEAQITVAPVAEGGQPAPASEPVVVKVEKGTLVDVLVSGPKGKPIAGNLNEDKTIWTSSADSLAFNANYTVKAKAVDADGVPAETSQSFKTVKPKHTATGYFVYFEPGANVGVGMPARIEFDREILPKYRKAIEERIEIKSSKALTGAWSWDESGMAVTFLPKNYWPAHDRVSITANIKGLPVAPGVFSDNNPATNFKTGSRLIATVDGNDLQMVVKRDGKTINTIPVTTGKPGFATPSGIMPIMIKEGTVIMDSATGGTPRGSSESYRLTVNYSQRLTWSGVYVHAAPWSVGSQGYYNSSHGCIGMSTSNASWFWGMTVPGDLVIVTNTSRGAPELGNGIAEWNVPTNKWLQASKTGMIVVKPYVWPKKVKELPVPADGGTASPTPRSQGAAKFSAPASI